jgi:hypothetical protein
MGRQRTSPRLLRRAGLGLGFGVLLTSVVAAQPAPPTAPTPAEPAAAPKPAPAEVPPSAPPASVAPIAPTPAEVKPAAVAPTPKATPTPETPVEVVTRRSRYDIAVIQALDKVTAETLRFEARVNAPVRWKGLIFTVATCEHSAPEEAIDDSIAYLTIDAQPRPQPGRLTPPPKQAFKGWMYASSPGLNPMQHATYDAWVISCRASAPPIAPAPARPPPAKPPEPKVLELPPAAAPALAPAPKAAEPAPKAAEPAPKAAPVTP